MHEHTRRIFRRKLPTLIALGLLVTAGALARLLMR